MGDPVFLARRQSRVAGKDPQPPMSNDIHRLPEHKLCAYNMGNPTVLLNKTPPTENVCYRWHLFWPSFSGRDPVKKQQERLGRATSDDRPPELEHYLPPTLLLLLPGSCAFPQTSLKTIEIEASIMCEEKKVIWYAQKVIFRFFFDHCCLIMPDNFTEMCFWGLLLDLDLLVFWWAQFEPLPFPQFSTPTTGGHNAKTLASVLYHLLGVTHWEVGMAQSPH